MVNGQDPGCYTMVGVNFCGGAVWSFWNKNEEKMCLSHFGHAQDLLLWTWLILVTHSIISQGTATSKQSDVLFLSLFNYPLRWQPLSIYWVHIKTLTFWRQNCQSTWKRIELNHFPSSRIFQLLLGSSIHGEKCKKFWHPCNAFQCWVWLLYP